jgi:hypothetical protein
MGMITGALVDTVGIKRILLLSIAALMISRFFNVVAHQPDTRFHRRIFSRSR